MPPDALLFISSQCPHCPAVLAGLSELLKRGVIGRLEVVNLEVHPQAAESLGVRSVPWLRLGPFELAGARAPAELETWARRVANDEGMADAFHDLLKAGDLRQVLALIAADPTRLSALLPIVANPDAGINVRVGAGAALEEYAGTSVLQGLIPALGALSVQPDARVRADACHYLGLTASDSARPWLAARLQDAEADVSEIARESLERQP